MPYLIALGGIPAVGKTTIVKEFFKNYTDWKILKFKKLYGHYNKKLNLVILGKYNNDVFCGTDKLSMAVQPDFNEFIQKKDMCYNILFEGDRLFNFKTLEKVQKNIKLIVYIVESDYTEKRHLERKDKQTQQFIKGRKTKIQNIKNYLNGNYQTLINNKKGDIIKNYNIILNNFI